MGRLRGKGRSGRAGPSSKRPALRALDSLRCSAPPRRPGLPGLAPAGPGGGSCSRTTMVAARQALPTGRYVGRRSAGAGSARAALRDLTCRDCLSGVSAANAASFCDATQDEHRSAVGAPPTCPSPGNQRLARRSNGASNDDSAFEKPDRPGAISAPHFRSSTSACPPPAPPPSSTPTTTDARGRCARCLPRWP